MKHFAWLAGPNDPDLPAWESYLKALRDQLIGNMHRAQIAYATLKKVRANLGLPFIDDTGGGEGSPASKGAWTSDLETQAQDVQAMSVLTTNALDETIAGKRKLQWDQSQGRFVIEALKGDLLRLEANNNGLLFLIDAATGQPTHVSGSLGVPAIVWAATAGVSVLALPTYFLVDAAVNGLTDAAEQKTIRTIAEKQFECVQSGKCTPAEAQAITKSLYDGAAGIRQAKALEESAKAGSTEKWADTAKTLGWVALGLGGIYLVSKLIPSLPKFARAYG